MDALKTASKNSNFWNDSIGNKIVDKSTNVSRPSRRIVQRQLKVSI